MNTLRTLLFFLLVGIGYDGYAQNLPEIPVNRGQGRNIIPGKFIVTLAEGVDPLSVAREHGMVPEHVYTTVLNGMAGSMGEAARSGMLRDRRVLRIEQDVIVTAEQSSWNLDRIDQRRLPLNGTYTRTYTGSGVTVYIVDAGIRYDHVEFGGRASFGYDAFGGNGSDCNGHGTHVAATVGGNTYGVANRVSLVSVRVLDCNGSGSMSGIIAGMDWIGRNRRLPAVANLSLGGSFVQAMNDAVVRLTNAGVVVVVAAGNENVNACNGSPASAPDAITVGATDQSDTRASFSNYGSCVDFFAPGVQIPAAYHTASNAYVYMSGTSMAAPHVAGAAALILQHNPSTAPRTVASQLSSYATKGVVLSSLSTNNHLLYSLEQSEGSTTPTPTPTNISPTVNFSQSCTSLSCTFTDQSTDADGSISARLWNFGNGVTSTVKNPTYSYPAAGTYTVSLRVTDNAGATATTSKAVTVSAPATTNTPPTANFTASCTSLSCGFTDQSTDAGGSIAAWNWNFGNGVTSTVRNPSYSYPAAGTYNVTLTVTDNAGAKTSITKTITVSSASTAQISLTLRGYKVSGYEYVEIRWSGATSQYVDIYMNGSRIGSVSNSGGVTHRTNLTGPRTLTYKVCNSGTSVCSANQSVTFY
jgi:subtilisin family serine protease